MSDYQKWGELRTSIQGTKTIYCKSIDEINNVFASTHKKRFTREYALIN